MKKVIFSVIALFVTVGVATADEKVKPTKTEVFKEAKLMKKKAPAKVSAQSSGLAACAPVVAPAGAAASATPAAPATSSTKWVCDTETNSTKK
jgi:hypothetical protein